MLNAVKSLKNKELTFVFFRFRIGNRGDNEVNKRTSQKPVLQKA